MAAQPVEKRTPDDRKEDAVNEAVEDTVPASDAPATAAPRASKSRPAVPGTEPDEDTPGEPSARGRSP